MNDRSGLFKEALHSGGMSFSGVAGIKTPVVGAVTSTLLHLHSSCSPTPPPHLWCPLLLALLLMDYWGFRDQSVPPLSEHAGGDNKEETSIQPAELQRHSMYGHLYDPPVCLQDAVPAGI